MQKAVIELMKLGPMPDSIEDKPSNELVGKYDDLLGEVKTPITEEELRTLIELFPKESMYEVEWGLLHLIETFYDEDKDKYMEIISQCPNKEWREILEMRVR